MNSLREDSRSSRASPRTHSRGSWNGRVHKPRREKTDGFYLARRIFLADSRHILLTPAQKVLCLSHLEAEPTPSERRYGVENSNVIVQSAAKMCKGEAELVETTIYAAILGYNLQPPEAWLEWSIVRERLRALEYLADCASCLKGYSEDKMRQVIPGSVKHERHGSCEDHSADMDRATGGSSSRKRQVRQEVSSRKRPARKKRQSDGKREGFYSRYLHHTDNDPDNDSEYKGNGDHANGDTSGGNQSSEDESNEEESDEDESSKDESGEGESSGDESSEDESIQNQGGGIANEGGNDNRQDSWTVHVQRNSTGQEEQAEEAHENGDTVAKLLKVGSSLDKIAQWKLRTVRGMALKEFIADLRSTQWEDFADAAEQLLDDEDQASRGFLAEMLMTQLNQRIREHFDKATDVNRGSDRGQRSEGEVLLWW